jgi:hypothetical protein
MEGTIEVVEQDPMCALGAKALHVLKHLYHPLLIRQASRPLRHLLCPHPRLHLHTFPPLFSVIFHPNVIIMKREVI